MHAEYNKEQDVYKTHRVTQAFDTAQFIESTRGDSILQILAGDLNIEKGDIAHRYYTGFSDATVINYFFQITFVYIQTTRSQWKHKNITNQLMEPKYLYHRGREASKSRWNSN